MSDMIKNTGTPLDQALAGDVYKDMQSGAIYRIVESYDVPTFTLQVMYSPVKDEQGKIMDRVPIFHSRLTNVVRMVPEGGEIEDPSSED